MAIRSLAIVCVPRPDAMKRKAVQSSQGPRFCRYSDMAVPSTEKPVPAAIELLQLG